MHAVTFDAPGDPDVLTWAEVDDLPAPGPGEVTIAVEAAGVNRADLLQRRGHYPVPPGASPVLGLECAGRITAIGDGTTGFVVGDAVCALLAGGGYAERVNVPAVQVLPVPRGLSMTDAAGLPEVACTVVSNLRMHADVREGDTVLVHGGGSGIGTFAIQWAKVQGATVIATAGSARKVDRARELGADVAVNYHEQDFVEAVRAATEGRGVDTVLDLVGAPYLTRNLDTLALDGRIQLIGGDSSPASVPLGLLMQKRATLSATTLRARPVAQKAAIVEQVRVGVWPEVEAGRIVPVIDTVLPIEQAAAAHRLFESGSTIGKVILQVHPH